MGNLTCLPTNLLLDEDRLACALASDGSGEERFHM
jgi:hypothetical protein